MSRRYESDCVDCGLPCIGRSCRYYRVAVDSCDVCGSDEADFSADGKDYCDSCLKKMLDEEWKDKSQAGKILALGDDIDECLDTFFEDSDLDKKAQYLEINISEIDDCYDED